MAEGELVSSPDPTHKTGKGLVTLLTFLGCAESAFTRHFCTKMYWHTCFLLIQHDQEKRAMSPDPFCGWGLGTRLKESLVYLVHKIMSGVDTFFHLGCGLLRMCAVAYRACPRADGELYLPREGPMEDNLP